MKTIKHKFLYAIVNMMIGIKFFSNHGKFKEGDRVRYNWRARVMIKSAIDDDVHVIGGYEPWAKDLGNVFFSDVERPSGCDTFWIEKV